jgi:isoquinoline 1-oxidoreductase beta subunit
MGKWTRRAFITSGVAAGGVAVFGVAIRRGDRSDNVAGLVASEGDSMFDVWLKISPDNRFTVFVPHAEMGQGVHTSLAMMLAEELDADWSQVDVVEAPAHSEYANYAFGRDIVDLFIDFPPWMVQTIDGLAFRGSQLLAEQRTGGSRSVKATGQIAMRATGAATRTVLLQAAANEWDVTTDELYASNGTIRHSASKRTATYAQFAAAAAELPLPTEATLKLQADFKILGTSPPRIDAPAKVDGSAVFGIDIVLPGMKYAAIKAAPVFGGSVRSFDASAITNMPGVRKVINLDHAVAVVADGYWQAKLALGKLQVDFDDSDNAHWERDGIYQKIAADLAQSENKGKTKADFSIGDAQGTLAESRQVIEAEYQTPFLAHATMEPMNCTAWVRDGTCDVWVGSQNPLQFGRDVGQAIGIARSKVTVHNQFLGGGFGRRVMSDVAVQAARIADEVHYPVKLVWSREEDIRQDFYRDASRSHFKAGLDDEGNVVAWYNHYANKPAGLINDIFKKAEPLPATRIPYDIPNQEIVYTDSENFVPWGFWRSVEHSKHAFFTESFIDEIAIAAGKDTYQYRRELLQQEPRAKAVLDLAAEKADWGSPLAENWGRGIALHRSFGTIVAQVVEVEVQSGKVRTRRVVCAVDAGFAVYPDGLIAQIESGIVYGLTAALYGEISISQGAVTESNFHDYPMLRMDAAPAIETHIINSDAPLGGAGEPGTPVIGPALTNAIFNATGKRIRELPVRKHDLAQSNPAGNDVA